MARQRVRSLAAARHQAARLAGNVLIINGHHYGWTSGDVMRNCERPMRKRLAERQRAYGAAWAEAIRLVSTDIDWA